MYVLIFSKSSKNSQQQVQTTTVTKGTIIKTISESGSVTSSNLTSVGSPTNGVLSELYVKNGDQVVAGQVLFMVKSTATPQEKTAAYSSLLSAQNNLNSAKAKINSLQSALFKANQAFVNDKGVGNPTDEQKKDPKYIEELADWQQAEADYNNQSNVIAQAQAALDSAALSYQQTQDASVTAPIDGTVANLSSNLGSNVSASGVSYNGTSSGNSSNSNASPVLMLGNFANLSIKAPVSEVDIASLKDGQKATITLDAYPDKTFVGRVQSIDSIGTNSSGVVTYNAYINLVSPPAVIKPGMTATAVIQLEKKDNVLMVPVGAVQTDSSGSYVREQKNGQITEVPITIGISSDTDTEVTSGLVEGEKIIESLITPPSRSSSTGTSPFSGLNRGFGGGGGAVFFRGGAGGGARAGARGGGG